MWFVFLLSIGAFSVIGNPLSSLRISNEAPFSRYKRSTGCDNKNDDCEKVVCYYGGWAKYRKGDGKFTTKDIDPNLCTHVIYSFQGIDPNTHKIKSLDPAADQEAFKDLQELKRKNPNLKIMAAIGGWNEGSAKFSKMAMSDSGRKAFVDSVSKFLDDNNLDGIDIDWEYPAHRGGSPADADNLPVLLKQLKQELHSKCKLLSIAVGMAKDKIGTAYKVKDIADNVDFINAMTYDFKGPWDGKTGHHTNMDDVEGSIDRWIEAGAPAKKINLGTAFYGKSYTTSGNSNGNLGVSATSPGTKGSLTGEAGLLGYNEICEKLKNGQLQTKNENSNEPTAFNGDQFVAYDSIQSVTAKNEWAKKKGLGGGMIWSIDTDDFKGKCNGEKYPLLNAMNDVWEKDQCGQSSPAEPNKAPTNSGTQEQNSESQPAAAPQPQTNSNPQHGNPCSSEGKFEINPANLRTFFVCNHGKLFTLNCPGGLVFTGGYHCTWPK